jgi:hypothetical protein
MVIIFFNKKCATMVFCTKSNIGKNKQTMQMYMILYLIVETKYMERCSIRKQKKIHFKEINEGYMNALESPLMSPRGRGE